MYYRSTYGTWIAEPWNSRSLIRQRTAWQRSHGLPTAEKSPAGASEANFTNATPRALSWITKKVRNFFQISDLLWEKIVLKSIRFYVKVFARSSVHSKQDTFTKLITVWIDLNKRFLPRPKTTTAWKLIPHRSKISKNWNPHYIDFSKTDFY